MPRLTQETSLLMSKRQYTIRSYHGVFDAGILRDGQQVLVGVQFPQIVAIRFSSQGSLIGGTVVASAASGSGALVDNHAAAELDRWKRKVGFQPTAITVEAFFLRDRWIGIEDLPQHYREVLDRPENFDEDRRLVLLDDIRQWQQRGDFVLYWDEDYYLNRSGEVVSS